MLTPDEYKILLRNDLTSFIARSFYELNPTVALMSSPFVEEIAAALEKVRQGRIRRLIVNLPPRHLKSHCASVAFPAWCLGHDPAGQIICASYGQDLADKFARDSRRVMSSRWYKSLFQTHLVERHPVHDLATTAQGMRFATSVGGVLTGRGANLIVIDDPLKPDEALSASRRDSVNEWYDNTLVTRLNNKATGAIVIIMQRLHQDDLVGHVLGQEKWDVLSFPAIAENDETHLIESPIGKFSFARRAGDALHPERESVQTLSAIRATIGEYNFISQYQQNPTPAGGIMVKKDWLRFYEPGAQPAKFDCVVQSWDTANKTTELSDFSVCTTWGALDRHFYLLDVVRQRLNYPDLKRKVVELARQHPADAVLIEDKASGIQLIQDLSGEIYGITGYTPSAGSDKPMRLHCQTAIFENGFVLLPNEAPWLANYVEELTSFPGCRYDDQVDSTSQALAYLREPSGLEIWARLGRAARRP